LFLCIKYVATSYDFVNDPSLKHLYVASCGHILTGKLFEDLDALAGNIAAVHCDDDDDLTAPLSLVTASVDKIIQRGGIPLDRDYVLYGQMAYVGNSSMDILIHMHTGDSVRKNGGECPPLSGSLLKSYFTYAARDPLSAKSVKVHRLLPETADEQHIFEERLRVVTERRRPPAEAHTSRARLTALVERGSSMVDMPALAHPNAVLMSRTALENCFLCQPQNVNTAGAVFGGFLSE
jgi:acyl-coenzyme A thioesterase 9